MEYLAGFYIVLGTLIIIFRSGFIKNNLYNFLINRTNGSNKETQLELKPSFFNKNDLVLQKVPVRVNKENPFKVH